MAFRTVIQIIFDLISLPCLKCALLGNRRCEDKLNVPVEDPRVEGYPLVGSPVGALTVIVLYILFVKKWGPAYMKDRKPYDVKFLIQLHNVIQIVINTYGFFIGLQNSYLQKDFSWTCQDVDVNNTSRPMMLLLRASYLYYISKYLDLFDTVFFVLRKKNNHVSFLHVYHHSIMVFSVWMYLTFFFGSHQTMLGVINTFIHMVMYTYYLVSSLDLKIDLLPWKKRITQIQIAQFCLMVVHFSMPIFNNWCNLKSNAIHTVALIQNIFMTFMFSDFYYKTYIKNGNKRKEIK